MKNENPKVTKISNYIDIIGISLCALALLCAEAFRIKSFLILDLIAPFFLTIWTIKTILLQKFEKKLLIIALTALGFFVLGFASLLINSINLTQADVFRSFLYGVRWISIFGLFFVSANLNLNLKDKILKLMILCGFILSVFGFIQLKIYPNFSEMTQYGWDPHNGRLLSTWFDPNLLGGFFAFLIPITAGAIINDFQKQKSKPYLLALTAVFLVILLGLFLTYSRSAYLGLIFGFGFFGLIYSRKFLLIGVLASIIFLNISDKGRERIDGLVQGVSSVFSETYTLSDASSRLRFASWNNGIQVFKSNILIGAGYNNYANRALELGLTKDTKIHSSNGSDSSLITILATTGIFGFGLWALVHFLILKQIWSSRKDPVALGVFSGFLGLLVHCIFVNSLLFSLLMCGLYICLGVAYKKTLSYD